MKIIVLLGLMLLITATVVSAGGVGISPSIVEHKDFLRGQEYNKYYKILNLEDVEKEVNINAIGDSADWFTFLDIETGEELTSLNIPKKSDVQFLALIKVPVDSPNGDYSGYVQATPVEKENKTGGSVILVARSSYKITVTGEENLAGTVQDISVSDTESGQNLRIKYDFRNTGNVKAKPVANVAIYSGEEIVNTFTSEGEFVESGSHLTQEALWDTEGRGTGDFKATVKITLGEDVLAEKDLEFRIEPRGTFSAEALVGEVKQPEQWVVDNVGKSTIEFYNTGKLDVGAKVIVEVKKDGKLVDVITGEEKFVKAGLSEELEYYYTPKSSGEYTLDLKVLYSGKETPVETANIRVLTEDEAKVNVGDFSSGSSLVTILIVVVVLLIIVSGIFIVLFYRRARH